MTNFFKSFAILILLFIAGVVFAVTPTTSTTPTPADQLVGLLGQYKSLIANFDQGVFDANGTLVQNSSGTMAIQRPENFRWFTKSPNEQLIITDGKKLWVYDIDLQQVTISKLLTKMDTTPAMLITSSSQKMQQNYNVSIYPAPDKQLAFQLLPKTKNSDFQWVRFFFINGQIHKMQIRDNIGQLTSIVFTQLKADSNLPKSTFVLTVPKGVDVVQE